MDFVGVGCTRDVPQLEDAADALINGPFRARLYVLTRKTLYGSPSRDRGRTDILFDMDGCPSGERHAQRTVNQTGRHRIDSFEVAGRGTTGNVASSATGPRVGHGRRQSLEHDQEQSTGNSSRSDG